VNVGTENDMKKAMVLSSLVFGALLTGCPSGTTGEGEGEGEGEATGEGEGEGDLAAAEQALIDAYTAKLEECTPLLILEPGYVDQLFAGSRERLPGAEYTAAEVNACAVAFAGISCAQVQDSSTIVGCEGLNTGTLANGDACIQSSQCQSGFCDRADGDCGVCAAVPDWCDTNEDCGGAQVCSFETGCVDAVALGGTCNEDTAPCGRDAYCSFDEVCVRTPGLGDACPDFECAEGAYCSDEDVCTAIPGLGGDCSDSFECTDGNTCDFETRLCIAVVPRGDAVGEPCEYNAAYSYTCEVYATEPLVCLPNGTCALVIPVELGGACDDDSRCIGSLFGSARCEAGTCVSADEDRIAIGDNCDVGTCVDGSYCGSNMDGDSICVAYVPLGGACSDDLRCEDGSCIDGACISDDDLYEQCVAN
jgi:hypothetical protein